MRCPKWITAQELDRWAATQPAKSLLPEVLRRLVWTTIPPEHIKKIDFPAGAEIHRPGYDGTTVVTRGTEFVPEGICFWELGCDVNNPKKKAQDDYDKRVEENQQLNASGETENLREATFIAVTATDWQACRSWAKDRNKDGSYKEIRAYDSNDLEQWLQTAPGVGLWLAQEIHGRRHGVIDISEHWKNVQGTLRRPLSPATLLVNRDAIKATFGEWLKKANGELIVKAASTLELITVFCAWVHTLRPQEQDIISSRTIIVAERETWRALATSQQPLILVASALIEPEPELFAEAVRSGHHVLRNSELHAGRAGIELPMIRRFDLQKALENDGFTEPEARQLSETAGGNFTILRRRIAGTEIQMPSWAKDGNLAPLLLAGTWEDKRPGDQRVVSALLGKNYSEAQATMTKWRQTSDMPVRYILGKWEFLSPVDAWEALNPFINSTQMNCFHKVAIEVLGEDNPALDLPAGERFMASVKGKVWQFSSLLRRGIAEILALGATRADESSVGTEIHFSAIANSIVRQVLPEGCSWKRWASLGELLSPLMEAAPDSVLELIERDIRLDDSRIVELLRQEVPGGITGAAYHTGVLWALETAAWPEKYMHRVSLCLVRLARRDPGGQWANRPLASAAHIFFSWRPQTVASFSERLNALENICRKEPVGAWKLLLALIPQPHGTFMDSAKPSYRNWAAGWTGDVADDEYDRFLSELWKMLVALINANPSLWPELLSEMTRLPAEGIEYLFSVLEKTDIDTIAEDVRQTLWEKLREFVEKQTYFRDAWWSLPDNTLTRVKAIKDKLAPDDPIKIFAHLFNDDGHMDGDKSESFEKKQERRLQERRSASRRIWERGGLPSVLELAKKVKLPWAVGASLAQELGDEAGALVIPSLLATKEDSVLMMAKGFAANIIHAKGIDWAECQVNEEWLSESIAEWASNMPFQTRTWDWIGAKGAAIEENYWSLARAWGWGQLEAHAVERAVKQFQKVGRPLVAIDLLIMVLHGGKATFSPDVICTALEAVATNWTERIPHTMDAYHIQEAFKFLHGCSDSNEERVANLEFIFLPFLDRHSRCLPMMLHRKLARDPAFFVDCLILLYQPRHSTKKEKAPEGSETALKAQRIWHLLRDWQTIPGTDAAGAISVADLRPWVAKVRQMAKETDRLETCDLTLGELFARSPEDTDKARPPIPVREIVEEIESEKLENGLAIGLHNLRGVFSKAMYEGGKQERELAVRFQQYAGVCSKWPRTAAVLRSVADDYLRQAQIEDERAKAQD